MAEHAREKARQSNGLNLSPDAANDCVSPAQQSPASSQLHGRAAASTASPSGTRSAQGQTGMWPPAVWQRIEALEEWVRTQLACHQRQHELKLEEMFSELQERLLALERDRPKLELSVAHLGGSVKAIVEQLLTAAQHTQASEMRQREWRRALEEHVRTELVGATRMTEGRLQEFHKQLSAFENDLRSRHSLAEAFKTTIATRFAVAELENGTSGPDTLQRSEQLHDLVQRSEAQAEQLSCLEDKFARCLRREGEEELRKQVSSNTTRVSSCEQLLVDHDIIKLQKEVTDISARLGTFEQALQETSDEEADNINMTGIDAGNGRGLDDMGETYSLPASDETASSQGDDH